MPKVNGMEKYDNHGHLVPRDARAWFYIVPSKLDAKYVDGLREKG